MANFLLVDKTQHIQNAPGEEVIATGGYRAAHRGWVSLVVGESMDWADAGYDSDGRVCS